MLTGAMVLFVLVIALLAIPFTLTFQVSWQQAVKGNIKVKWLFGLVCVRFSPSQFLSRSKVPYPVGEAEAKKTSESAYASREKHNVNVVTLFRHSAFRRRILRFVSDFWRAIHKTNLSLFVRAGLGDPADTGQLWAFVGPLAGMLAHVQAASIEIVPDFLDTTFELHGSGVIRVIPLQIIYLTGGVLLSPVVWQAIKLKRSGKKT